MEGGKINDCKTVALRTPLVTKEVQCVGRKFLQYHNKKNNIGHVESTSSSTKISTENVNFFIDVDFLRSLDPKEWKDQDHYAVLGLKELRFVSLLNYILSLFQ